MTEDPEIDTLRSKLETQPQELTPDQTVIVKEARKDYDLKSLTVKATGETLSPTSLIRYLKDRYLPLYG